MSLIHCIEGLKKTFANIRLPGSDYAYGLRYGNHLLLAPVQPGFMRRIDRIVTVGEQEDYVQLRSGILVPKWLAQRNHLEYLGYESDEDIKVEYVSVVEGIGLHLQ